jgi:hypothetical protein
VFDFDGGTGVGLGLYAARVGLLGAPARLGSRSWLRTVVTAARQRDDTLVPLAETARARWIGPHTPVKQHRTPRRVRGGPRVQECEHAARWGFQWAESWRSGPTGFLFFFFLFSPFYSLFSISISNSNLILVLNFQL